MAKKETPVKVVLTKGEIDEFLLTTSFEKDEILALRDSFAKMQSDPIVCGKVCLQEFAKFLKMKDESLFAKKLFEKLDMNKDSYLTFFDLMTTIDSFHQKEFKTKLKFYYETFCESDKQISKAKMVKMSKEIVSQFNQVVLPDDFILNMAKSPEIIKSSQPLQRRGSVNSNDVEEGDKETEVISLDEFFDHFEKVFPVLQ
jgi:Ca2+-binding EF-hand superfamily protein